MRGIVNAAQVRVAGIATVFCLTLASCGWALDATDTAASPLPTTEPADASAAPTEAPASTGGARRPLFALRLVDANGRHPSGIPVRLTGEREETLFSDENGEVKITGPPGTYELRVVKGCHDEVIVRDGGGATVRLTRGGSRTAETQVDWRHRYAPSPPAFLSTVKGNWSIGMQVDLRYPVHDRCTQDEVMRGPYPSAEVAPGASYPTYVWRPADSIEIVGDPALVAGDDGYGRVSVRCKAPGDVLLFSEDEDNPQDSINIISGTFEGRRPRCGTF